MDIYRILKICIFKLARPLHVLLPKKSMRKSYRAILRYYLKVPSKRELEKTFQIMSNAETLDYILENKCCLCRYGDGEIVYFLDDTAEGPFQPQNRELRERLKFILKNPTARCLTALPPWLSQIQPREDYYEQCQVNYWYELKKILNVNDLSYHYGSSFIFTPYSFTEDNTDKIKALWKGRDVALVKGKNSAFIFDERLFEAINLVETIETKAVDAYSDYENIINKIKNSANITEDTLILLAVGLTATVLAYDLSELGYQAIDIGHVSNYYLEYLNEMPNIEKLRMSKSYIDGETNILDLINNIL